MYLTPLWQNGNSVLNSHDFTTLLQHPQQVNAQKTEALKRVVTEHPYFQAAKALYLKGLRQQESETYNTHLKITAAYTTDRSILFDFITSNVFLQNEISKNIKQNNISINAIDVTVSDVSTDKHLTVDDVLKQHIKDTDGVLDPELFQPKSPLKNNTTTPSQKVEAPQERTPEATLNLGKPLVFEKRETHSFNEWLKLTTLQPVKRTKSAPVPQQELTPEAQHDKEPHKIKQNELIDKFIAENPKITPKKASTIKNNPVTIRVAEPEGLMTETLARIYVEQKNYKKAIQSYKILSLKYPEKSSFFANQIKAVEQLQEQNK